MDIIICVLIIAIVIIIVSKDKIAAFLPFFKKGNTYQNNINGENNNTSIANGDNASSKSVNIYGNVNIHGYTPSKEPLTNDDKNKLNKWVNSKNTTFERYDSSVLVRFVLGTDNEYSFDPKRDKKGIASMEGCLRRMNENGYIEEFSIKNSTYKWYKLTDKAFKEFINN